MSIKDDSLYLCGMLLKTSFILPHMFCNVNFELIRMFEFQNTTNIKIIGFYLKHFGLVVDS